MMELMKRELEQLRRQVTDRTWTGMLVKRYVVPAGGKGKETCQGRAAKVPHSMLEQRVLHAMFKESVSTNEVMGIC